MSVYLVYYTYFQGRRHGTSLIHKPFTLKGGKRKFLEVLDRYIVTDSIIRDLNLTPEWLRVVYHRDTWTCDEIRETRSQTRRHFVYSIINELSQWHSLFRGRSITTGLSFGSFVTIYDSNNNNNNLFYSQRKLIVYTWYTLY